CRLARAPGFLLDSVHGSQPALFTANMPFRPERGESNAGYDGNVQTNCGGYSLRRMDVPGPEQGSAGPGDTARPASARRAERIVRTARAKRARSVESAVRGAGAPGAVHPWR